MDAHPGDYGGPVPRRRLRVSPSVLQPPAAGAIELKAGFEAIRLELEVDEHFAADVLDEAARSARNFRRPDLDLTGLAFATLDPAGSTDLDQAYLIERAGTGFRLRYAIADVGAFVDPGGLVDTEAHRRVETLYGPDGRIPLHPPVLSDGAASLLPGVDRPALVWTLDLDETGELTRTDVRRAMVRSREQQDYLTVQAAIDAGTAPESVLLLRELGRLRLERERSRGGMSLNTPEQEVVPTADGTWGLRFRAGLPVEDWNAQMSLLTGMAAAGLMLAGGIGVLRTMPPADPRDIDRLRRIARGLGIAWAADDSYGALLSTLDAKRNHDAAFLSEATSLFRGAAYAAFDGAPPAVTTHAAIAATYTHCTAPLRRLVDRYAGEVCLALCAGVPVPDWVRAALPTLPEEMATGIHKGNTLDRADVDLVEAALLRHRMGEVFDSVVVDLDEKRGGGVVQLTDPAVLARCASGPGGLPLGEPLRVRLTAAEIATRTVRFEPA